MHYANQRAALTRAAQLVEALPADTTFGIEVTDEDTYEDPSVMNIYAGSHDDQIKLVRLLGFEQERPVDMGEHFRSYRAATLLVSFMEPDTKETR